MNTDENLPSYEELSRPLSAVHPKAVYYASIRAAMGSVGRLSDGIRLGYEAGFDSGVMLEYVYRNQASGRGPLGKLIDRIYLDSPGWKGIRGRGELLKAAVGRAIDDNHRSGRETRLLDVACGGGRYVLEAMRERPSTSIHACLRDYKRENVEAARELAQGLGVSVRVEPGDAFNDSQLDALRPRPNTIIVSGLHEILPDNDLIRTHFTQLARTLERPGVLIFTVQPHHPQLELIARVLPSHTGGRWVMRLRPLEQTLQWARQAGFDDFHVEMEPSGIFGVCTARLG
ncbi:MAG: class I SAM-dependent methyltransferase family protein [Alphaproteobacteria bacterium]